MSLLAQCAQVDFSSPGKLTDFPGCRLDVFDNAGKKATGYIGAPGAAMGYGPNLITGGDFSSGAGWTCDSGFQVTLNVARATAAPVNHGIVRALQTEDGALYEMALVISGYSAGIMDLDGIVYPAGINANGPAALYITAMGLNSWAGVLARTALTCDTDNLTLRKLVAPGPNGVTILSYPGGPQSRTSIDTGFNRRDPAGYTAQIYRNNRVYACTGPGVSGATPPAFDIAPASVTADGEAQWTECTPTSPGRP